MSELQQQAMFAAFLINLGLTTVEQVRALFAHDGHDEETLANIMVQVDARLARREDRESRPPTA